MLNFYSVVYLSEIQSSWSKLVLLKYCKHIVLQLADCEVDDFSHISFLTKGFGLCRKTFLNTFLEVAYEAKFFSHIFEIYHLKYTIPKFEMFRIKINDFTSLQSCAILPSKIVKGMGPS